jgi:hypothetical protein
MSKHTTLIMRPSDKAQFLKCEISKKLTETNYLFYFFAFKGAEYISL